MFESISTQKTYQKIVEQIQNMIIDGTFKSGDKLPAERELTEQLQVSRSSLREGLKALEVLGLVESKQGEGSFITNKVGDTIIKSVSIAYKLNDGKIEDVLELRHSLEVYSVKKAIKSATDDQIKELERIVVNMKGVEDVQLEEELDILFHSKLIEITGNILVHIVSESVSDLIGPSIKAIREIYSDNDSEVREYYFFQQHKDIVDAIREKDEAKAVRAVEEHLKLSEEDIMKLSNIE